MNGKLFIGKIHVQIVISSEIVFVNQLTIFLREISTRFKSLSQVNLKTYIR